jgi:hypothetical protein
MSDSAFELFSDIKVGDYDRLLDRTEAFKAAFERDLSRPGQGISKEAARKLGVSKDVSAGAFTNAPGGGTGGVPGTLRPYDLPSLQMIMPKVTPVRNSTPRIKGEGGAHEVRQLTGVSNSRFISGLVPDITLATNTESASTTFGNIAGYRRGPIVGYTYNQKWFPYTELSVSDEVTDRAWYSSLGFTDANADSALALLISHMMGEEALLIAGRGATSAGYSGPFGGGSGLTPSAPTASASTTGGVLASGSYTVAVAYRAGAGFSVSTAAASATSVTGPTGSLTVTTAVEAGSFGTAVFAELSGVWYYCGLLQSGTSFVIAQLGAEVNPQLPFSSDTTSTNGFDGLLTYAINGPNYNSSGGEISSVGLTPFYNQLESMYQNYLADPDELWVHSAQATALSEWIQSDSAANGYRLEIRRDEVNDIVIGQSVSGIVNPVTRKVINLRAHPLWPEGVALFRSVNFPADYANNPGPVAEVAAVQDYMLVEWPQIEFARARSTYCMETLAVYAPQLYGAIGGLS